MKTSAKAHNEEGLKMTKTDLMAYAGCIVAACACMTENTAKSADNTETNQTMAVRSDMFTAIKPASQSLWHTYGEKLDDGGTTVFKDRFGPRSQINWLRSMDTSGYDIIRQWNDSGQNAFGNAFGYALQETIITSLPVEEWKQDTEGTVWNVPVRLFEGSLGQTVEERAIRLSPIASYAVEESSWQEYVRNDINGGYRLFRKNPYIFMDASVGRQTTDQGKGQRIALIGFRCHSNLMDRENIGIISIEPHAVIFFPGGFQVQAGMSIHPTKFNKHGYGPTEAVSLTRAGNAKLPDFSIGFQSGEHSQDTVVCLTKSF